MKRSVVVFVACLVLVLVGAAVGGGMLHGDRNDVEVTAEVISGDISAAEGFTAYQSAISQDRLLWDLTIPLGQPEHTETVFTYSKEEIVDIPVSSRPLHINIDSRIHFSVEGEDAIYADRNSPLLPLCLEVTKRAPKDAEVYSETVFLEDHLDYYPLQASVWTPENDTMTIQEKQYETEVMDALNEYFRFPVPPGTKWCIEIRSLASLSGGQLSGTVCNAGNTYPDMELLEDWKGNTFYFTFGSESDPLLSYENIPGGLGVYRLEVAQEGERFTVVGLDTPYSLPEGAEVLDLRLSTDKKDLLVSYGLGDTYTLLVFDPDTMELRQSLPIPAEPPLSTTGYRPGRNGESVPYPYANWDAKTMLTDENLVLLAGSDNFYLFTRADGRYQFEFPFSLEGFFHPSYPFSAVWTGEKLALGGTRSHKNFSMLETGLNLWVFADGELLYQGDYSTSLNQTASEEAKKNAQDNPDYNPWESEAYAMETKPLTIAWTG